jgi:hypothetical protein
MVPSTESAQAQAPSGENSQSARPLSPSAATMDFFTLSRPIQDRFLASAAGTGVPARALFEPATQARALGWLALAILAPVALLALLSLGFGNLHSSLALQPVPMVVVHAGLAALAAAALGGYSLARSRARRFPYRLGTYVFPVGVVEALSSELRLYPFGSLVGFTTSGGNVALRFPSKTFRFKLPADTSAEKFETWVEDVKSKYNRALASHNRRELAVLDPLRDSGFSNPLSSSLPHQRPKEGRTLRLGAAVLVGALLGSLLFFARNKLGERLIYKAAVEANTVEAFKAYLARGGHRPEVSHTLLPTAELAEARGSLAAVEQYSEANPDSAIRPLIDVALREEMLTALEQVRKEGTLAAILAFEKEHPKHAFVAAELANARKAVFATAIKHYDETSMAGPNVKAFFSDLIKYSEKHGPQVEVRFRMDVPKSADIADSSIRKSAYYTGPSALPSQYFAAKFNVPREAVAGEKIVKALQADFSKEILAFQLGERLENVDDLPEVKVPTLFITQRPEMSGGYTTQRPRGVYVGIGFMVFTRFAIPEGARIDVKKQSWWLPPDINQIWAEKLTPEQVYDQAARQGLDRYVDKLLGVLDPSEPSEGNDAEVPAVD